LEKIMVPSEIDASKISSLILPTLENIKPEVVVVYFESQVCSLCLSQRLTI
jgi:hypothetical protein